MNKIWKWKQPLLELLRMSTSMQNYLKCRMYTILTQCTKSHYFFWHEKKMSFKPNKPIYISNNIYYNYNFSKYYYLYRLAY